MFSSVTTACRGRTRFRWNSGETFQQETRRRHQKPKAMLISSSRVTFARVARVGNISFNFCDAVPEQDLPSTWIQLIFLILCFPFRIQFTLFVCSIEPVLHACSHSIGHSLHSFLLSFASEPRACLLSKEKQQTPHF